MALNGANGTDQVWFTIGTAADAAGVARRSAFRWVALGAIPARWIGKRRCIEIGALRRFAMNRGGRASLASVDATPPCEAAPPPSPADEETIAALSEGLAAAQEMTNALFNRVARLERLLRVSRT